MLEPTLHARAMNRASFRRQRDASHTASHALDWGALPKQGRLGNQQVVSEAWIRDSLKPHTRSRWSGREYGYDWWIDTLAGYHAYYGYGHGGQFVFIVPDLKLTAVTTSSTIPRQERRERRMHRWAIYDLFEQDLIPAAATGGMALERHNGTGN